MLRRARHAARRVRALALTRLDSLVWSGSSSLVWFSLAVFRHQAPAAVECFFPVAEARARLPGRGEAAFARRLSGQCGGVS